MQAMSSPSARSCASLVSTAGCTHAPFSGVQPGRQCDVATAALVSAAFVNRGVNVTFVLLQHLYCSLWLPCRGAPSLFGRHASRFQVPK